MQCVGAFLSVKVIYRKTETLKCSPSVENGVQQKVVQVKIIIWLPFTTRTNDICLRFFFFVFFLFQPCVFIMQNTLEPIGAASTPFRRSFQYFFFHSLFVPKFRKLHHGNFSVEKGILCSFCKVDGFCVCDYFNSLLEFYFCIPTRNVCRKILVSSAICTSMYCIFSFSNPATLKFILLDLPCVVITFGIKFKAHKRMMLFN